jgi:2-oxopent-4-enoate hydratase
MSVTCTDEQLDTMAAELWRRLRLADAGPPVMAALPNLDVADAYRIQIRSIDQRCADTKAHVVGHKIGATNPVIQQLFGVGAPDFGHLLDDMVVTDGAVIDIDRLIAPRVEIEVAFLLAAPLCGPGVTVADVLVATAGIVPVFEVIDSRITDWNITIEDTVADNGSSAMVVLGERVLGPTEVDLRTIGAVLEIDGDVVATGAGAASLGHPARAVAWLANALAAHGQQLERGHLVLSGALTTAPPVRAGTTVRGHIAHLGAIDCSFRSER